MRILFLTPYFYPHIGGVEKHVEEISKRLLEKGHEVFLITQSTLDQKDNQNLYYQSSPGSASEAKKSKQLDLAIQTNNKFGKNFKIAYLDFREEGKLKKFRIWLSLWKNRKIIREADIVHCHDVFVWYLPFRFIFFNKPVYTTFHGYEEYPLRKKTLLIRKASELLSSGNICIGDFIKKWYKTKPTFISYGAVDKKFKAQSLKYHPKDDRPRDDKFNNSAIFFGRLDEQTGVQTYVKAYGLIKKKIPEFDFLIIGQGKYRAKIPSGIKVENFTNNISDYLVKYHFAFVSRYLSILEAMAAKRLVFAVYDNPIKRDYLKMAPYSKYIIITDSANELSKKVKYFLDNPEEEKHMVEQAYEWVKDQTWDNLVSTYLKLWSQKS